MLCAQLLEHVKLDLTECCLPNPGLGKYAPGIFEGHGMLILNVVLNAVSFVTGLYTRKESQMTISGES
jgi:hypothetical protein